MLAELAYIHAVERKMQHDDALALLVIRYGSHGAHAVDDSQDRVQFFFNSLQRNHLAADLGESSLSPGKGNEAIFVEFAHVARDIPAVPDGALGIFRLAQISH